MTYTGQIVDEIAVRPAEYEDRFALARLVIDATQDAFRSRVPDRCLEWLTVEESAANWGRNFTNGALPPDQLLFVAEVAGADVIGLAMARRRSTLKAKALEISRDHPSELVSLQVDPAWQRRGVGRILVAKMAQALEEEGELTLLVRVLAENPNLPFYERLGARYIESLPYVWQGFQTKELVFLWDHLGALSLADCRIVEESPARLAELSAIPIRFEVRSQFQINGDDPDSAELVELPVEPSWVKDYDAIEGDGPASWARRWDVSNWGLLAAYKDGRRVAACVLAHNTDGVNRLEGHSDVVALWDIRVHPDYRKRGLGRRLFQASLEWARNRNCREMTVETQNINVPACRFYARQGCRLKSIDRLAYEAFPDEVQLIWSLSL